jgi:hypothetical protein
VTHSSSFHLACVLVQERDSLRHTSEFRKSLHDDLGSASTPDAALGGVTEKRSSDLSDSHKQSGVARETTRRSAARAAGSSNGASTQPRENTQTFTMLRQAVRLIRAAFPAILMS